MAKYLNLLVCVFVCICLSGCDIGLFQGATGNDSEEPEELPLLWFRSFDTPETPNYFSLTRALPLDKDRVAVALNDFVAVLESESGEVIWSQNHGRGIPLQNRNFGFEEDLLVGNTYNAIMAWDADSGELQWQILLDEGNELFGYSDVTFDGENFLFAGRGGEGILHRIHKDGTKISSLDLESGIFHKVYLNGVLYVTHAAEENGDYAANLTAYDLPAGTVRWRFQEPGYGRFARMLPHIENGVIYAGTMQGDRPQGFFALDQQTGQEIWRSEKLYTYEGIVGQDRIYGTDAMSVWAIDKETGQLVWRTKNPISRSEQGMDLHNGKLYWANTFGLVIFDAATGEVLQIVDPPGSYVRNVVIEHGYIFVTTVQAIAVYRAM